MKFWMQTEVDKVIFFHRDNLLRKICPEILLGRYVVPVYVITLGDPIHVLIRSLHQTLKNINIVLLNESLASSIVNDAMRLYVVRTR